LRHFPPTPALSCRPWWKAIATLDAAADDKARSALEAHFKELDDRIKLCAVKDAVLGAIARYRIQAALHKCLTAVKTTAISHKATELSEKVITHDLEAALNDDFRRLNVGELHVRLKPFGVKGKTYYKLVQDLPGQQRPALVLSEREQRAIAIGSFLAEVNISGTRGGIVFDDPVSSLDHKRRGLVARRLAEEAGKRHVIVFTHDLYFLCLLQSKRPVCTALR
jgi:recombinational DNA repair ATPase RecF